MGCCLSQLFLASLYNPSFELQFTEEPKVSNNLLNCQTLYPVTETRASKNKTVRQAPNCPIVLAIAMKLSLYFLTCLQGDATF